MKKLLFALMLLAFTVDARIGSNELYYVTRYGAPIVTKISKIGTIKIFQDGTYQYTVIFIRHKANGIIIQRRDGEWISINELPLLFSYITKSKWRKIGTDMFKTRKGLMIYRKPKTLSAFTKRLL